MRLLSVLLAALAVALSAVVAPVGAAAAAGADAAHNSRNALDWAGTYEGVLPCADCPGIQTRLSLREDGSYALSTLYLDRSNAPRVERGRFAWQPGGNAIQLGAQRRGERFAVGEGRLAWLEPGAAPRWPQPARFVLERIAAADAPQAAQGVLESNRWTLVSAADAQGRPVDALAADPKRPIAFQFSAGRIHVEGGCNRSFGGYRIDDDGRLVVGRIASTMMACDPASMKVDERLAALLAEPAKIELTPGPRAALRLVSAQAGTLDFSGALTPEARYGAATRVFLEVAAQPVACSNPLTGATSCLSVRDRVFDAQGLAVGAPGAWRPLYEAIEGYTHEPGVRNVLRLKRFERAGGGPVYVLDLVVESETVAR